MTADVPKASGVVRRLALPVAVAVLFACLAYLAFSRLDNAAFWDDEAYVGIIARNFLATGTFTGWDGRNLLAFRNGRMLDSHLNYINPPLDCLVAAGAFRLFGQTTWVGRFPFVVAGLIALAVFAVIAWRDFRDQPVLWAYALVLLGLSVVFLLNIRQCRYYSIGLLFALLSYDAYRRCLTTGRLRWYLVFTAAVIALFYSSFLFCGAFLGALAVVHVVFHWRELKAKDLWKLALAIALVAAATVPYAAAHRIWHRPDIERGELWYHRKPVLLWWNLRELNMLGLPWMAAVLLIVVLAARWRQDRHLRGILEYACLGIGYTMGVALLSPQPTGGAWKEADIRYLLPAVPFLAVMAAAGAFFLHQRFKPLGAAMVLLVVMTNLPSAHPGGWTFRWLLPGYVQEVHHEFPTAYSEAVGFLRGHASQDDSVFAWPEYTNYPIMFYLGDRVKLCCLLDRRSPLPAAKVQELERAGAPLLLDRHYPDWIVFFGTGPFMRDLFSFFSRVHVQDGELVRMNYTVAALLNVYWFPTSRPELHLHTFGPRKDFYPPSEGVYVLRGTLVQASPPPLPQTHPAE